MITVTKKLTVPIAWRKTVTLLNEISETRYLQLAGTWAEAIRRGTLLPGSRLPSGRRSCAGSRT